MRLPDHHATKSCATHDTTLQIVPCRDPKGRELKAAPDDEKCLEAWKQIMRLAEDHCLILQAYGGVATLALPEEQRKAGVRKNVLRAHLRTETEKFGD
jgi:hypothetical protein